MMLSLINENNIQYENILSKFYSGRTFSFTPELQYIGLKNAWLLHTVMRKEFCEEDWCLKLGDQYPPISRLVDLLDEYFDEVDSE